MVPEIPKFFAQLFFCPVLSSGVVGSLSKFAKSSKGV